MTKDLIAKYGKAKGPAYRENKVRKAERFVLGVRIGGAVLLGALAVLLYAWVPAVATFSALIIGAVSGAGALIWGIAWVVSNYARQRRVIEHSKSSGILEDE